MVLRISQVFYVFKQYQKLKINASYYVYENFISNIHFDIADMKKKTFIMVRQVMGTQIISASFFHLHCFEKLGRRLKLVSCFLLSHFQKIL